MKTSLISRIPSLLSRIATFAFSAGTLALLQVHGEPVEIQPLEHTLPITVPSPCMAVSWVAWPDAVPHDSLKSALLSTVHLLKKTGNKRKCSLTEALCWHLLYRAGIDAGAAQAAAIIDSLVRSGCRNRDLIFLKGVHLIWTGKTTTGLLLLDSLKSSIPSDDDHFIRDYLKVMSQCFLPAATILQPSTAMELPPKIHTAIPLADGENIPGNVTWSLHESVRYGLTAGFTLSLRFDLITTPVLRFPMLVPTGKSSLVLSIDTLISPDIPRPYVHDPFAYSSPVDLKIYVIPGRAPVSPHEYMYTIVKGRFDQVRITDDLPQLGAVSVRCRNLSFFRNGIGTYHAFTVFDADLVCNNRSISFKRSDGLIKKEEFPVRYLLAMSANDIVEQKAEKVFRSICALFQKRMY